MFPLTGKQAWRRGCSIFICTFAYNLVILYAMRNQPSLQNPKLSAQQLMQAVRSIYWGNTQSGLWSGCGSSRMISGMSKPGFGCCCFHSVISPHYYKFSSYFYTSFQADMSFVWKLSLHFTTYCLTKVTVVIILISFEQILSQMLFVHTDVYAHFSALLALVILAVLPKGGHYNFPHQQSFESRCRLIID